jgi:3'5'-cyclic nucleotide phosphodiesterase
LYDRKWLTPRSEQVNCKGKGLMSTFWVEPSASSIPDNEMDSQPIREPPLVSKVVSRTEMNDSDEIAKKLEAAPPTSPATERLVDWTMGLFLALLEKMLVLRSTNANSSAPDHTVDSSDADVISSVAKEQLREYVTCIAKLHRSCEFHNFEHACHVAMATNNLLSAIADNDQTSMVSWQGAMDPITELALLFAALVHGVDHPAVANTLPVLERDAQAVAQHSVSVAWGLLMEPQFAELQTCLFATSSEREKLRQTVVDAVLASNSSDNNLDVERWQHSVAEQNPSRLTKTIVHLTMRAAVVSHAMQHFTIYKKWCTRLLTEAHQAHLSSGNLSAVNPTETWYEHELALFDDYVIPLATKLTACGLFGAASEDCLAYARDNRMEWEGKGRDIIDDSKLHFLWQL